MIINLFIYILVIEIYSIARYLFLHKELKTYVKHG